MTSWKYDNPELRDNILTGETELSPALMDDLETSFIEWYQTDEHSVLINKNTNETFVTLNPKRGNESHAKKKLKTLDRLEKNMKGLVYDMPVKGQRTSQKRDSFVSLITLGFRHEVFDVTVAWDCIKSGIINRFRSQLSDLLGTSYGSFTVKEGQKSGHPSPHILLITDKPFRFFSYNKKWRLEDYQLLTSIKRMWERCCYDALEERNLSHRAKAWEPTSKDRYLCFMDFQGVIDGKRKEDRKRSAISYVMKYMTKCIDPSNKTALRTHVFQKLFNMRDVLSKDFLNRINSSKDISRLDLIRNELKTLQKEITRIESLSTAFGFLISQYPAELRRLYDLEDKLLAEIPQSEWIFVKSVRTLEEYLQFLVDNNLEQKEVIA